MNSQITLYVDQDNGPIYSIQEAIDSADFWAASDVTIQITEGVYLEQIEISPTITSSLSIIANPGNIGNVVIDVSDLPSVDANFVLRINNSTNVFVEGIDFINNNVDYGRVIMLDGLANNNITFSFCSFIGADVQGMDTERALFYSFTETLEQISIENCIFENGTYGAYFEYVTSPAYEIDFLGCQFSNFEYAGIYANVISNLWIQKSHFFGKGATANQIGVFLEGVSSDIVINACSISLNAASSNNAILLNNFDESASAFISNNMISISGSGENHALQTYDATPKMFHNNVLMADGNSLSSTLKIEKTYSYANFPFIVNNIFSSNTQGYIYDIQIFDDLASDNNVFNFVNGINFANYNGSDIPTYTSWSSTYGQDNNSLEGDPDFVSPDDLHVNNIALVQGNGIVVGEPYSLALHDYDGQLRKDPPDIGADEIGSFAPSNIDSDTTWEGIVYVDSTVQISGASILTIMPGTQVIFLDTVGIVCYGSIQANGTAESPIAFFSGTQSYWGGIELFFSSTSNFEFCSFHNSYNENGGALYFNNCSFVSISKCIFEGNNAYYGGAIYLDQTNLTIDACKFNYNTADENGGAIFVNAAQITVTNTIFYNNMAVGNGGDLAIWSASTDCILSHNTHFGSTAGYGECIYNLNSPTFIHNSILSGQNTEIIVNASGNLDVANCDVEGGENGIISANTMAFILDVYPEFVDTTTGNFRLTFISPVIDKGDAATYTEFDADGNLRTFGVMPDLGAYEYQGYALIADAGEDVDICENYYQLLANNPHDYSGTWSFISGSGDFVDENNPNTIVNNLSNGSNVIRWTVSDGFNSVFDDVIITNSQPFVDAGDDIQLVSDYPNLLTTTFLNASALVSGEIGYWSCIDPFAIIVSTNSPSTQVENLPHGETIFRWTVSNGTCVAYDEIIIANGYGFNSNPVAKGLDWNNPDAWDVGSIYPVLGDVVTIYGTDIHVTSSSECSRLYVSSSSELVIDGNGKSAGNLVTNRLFIEQNAEKFPKLTDTAKVTVRNGTLTIKASSSSLDEGLFVGAMSRLTVKPAIASDIAEVHIGSGRKVVIMDTTSVKTAGSGEVRVSNGGKLFIEQNAEKNSNTKDYGNDVHIGSGGRLFIEQNAEKNGINTEVNIGAGRRIFIEQNAEKAAGGGSINIGGGRLFIEQNAEKGPKSSFNEVVIGNGGRIFIEQNAEKNADSSYFEASRIYIANGGGMIIGSNAKGNISNVHSNRIFIEQNAEKTNISDTAIIINSSGSITIQSSNFLRGQIYQASNTAVSILNGGFIKTIDSSLYSMAEGASLIDENDVSGIYGTIEKVYLSGESDMFSSPFFDMYAYQLEDQFVAKSWDESLNQFQDVISSDLLNEGNGYMIQNTENDVFKKFYGNFNSGDILVGMSVANLGINFVGNPYPSAIDWNLLNLDPDVQTAFYIYDFDLKNYRIYQSNGLNFNQPQSVISANKGFFIVSETTSDFIINNTSRVHFSPESEANTIDNSLIFNVGNGMYNDKIGFILDETASDSYNTNEDVMELPPVEQTYISMSATSSDFHNLAIDSRPMPIETSSIPLNFNASDAGNYTITMEENLLNDNIEHIYLYDSESNTTHDFIDNPDYSFNYSDVSMNRTFELSFAQQVDIKLVNDNNVQIYSYSDNVFIIANNHIINNVEIFSVTGEKLISKSVNSSNVVIPTYLPQGVYIVKAFVDGEIFTAKIVL